MPLTTELQCRFDLLYDPLQPKRMRSPDAAALLQDICAALESGTLRMVEGDGLGNWRVRSWLKQALVQLSGGGSMEQQPGVLPGSELNSLGWQQQRPLHRRVPAGSSIRHGAYLAAGVAVMPPSTVQAGAAILEGASIDSHCLVGTGVLVGEGAVVGCGTMLAGALLPAEALPVILERGVVVGGNCGLYGPMVVGERSSIFAGTIIRAAAGAFHPATRTWLLPDASGTLRLPPGCTVGMGLPPAENFPDGIPRLSPIFAD